MTTLKKRREQNKKNGKKGEGGQRKAVDELSRSQMAGQARQASRQRLSWRHPKELLRRTKKKLQATSKAKKNKKK